MRLSVQLLRITKRTKVSSNAIYSQLGVVKAVTGARTQSREDTSDVAMIAQRKMPFSSDAVLERTRQQMLALILSNRSVYNSKKQNISPKLFENETHRKLLNCILAFYDIGKNIDTSHILEFFTEEDEIKEVSLILSLDNKSDDDMKAFDDYYKVITDKMNRKKILTHLGADRDDKIEILNKIMKNK